MTVCGWILLGVFFSTGVFTIYYNVFGDEADNLVVGSFIQQGYILYRDVFSHHFPFPYYWMAMVVGLIGKSLWGARLSLLLFQTGAFGISMRLSRYHLALGLAAAAWGVLRLIYSGQMVLYSSFCAAALIVVFSVSLRLIEQKNSPSWMYGVVGIFSAISILCDPLSVYAAGAALGCLFMRNAKQASVAAAVCALGLMSSGLVLIGTGTVGDFWRDAVLFNSQIYAKYTYTDPNRFVDLGQMLLSGLGIGDTRWLNLDPFRAITHEYSQYDQWFYSGFLYRAVFLIGTAMFILKRQWRLALFLYLFAAATLIIRWWDFHAQPFVLTALLVASIIVTGYWTRVGANQMVNLLQNMTRLAVGVVLGWLVLMTVRSFFSEPNVFAAGLLTNEQAEIKRIEAWTCGQDHVLLAYYPGAGYYYWFTDLKPVSKYTFMWPWVAESGLFEVVATLHQDHILAIIGRQDDLTWGQYDTKVYLRTLDEYLTTNYTKVSGDLYLSPDLATRCQQR